MGLVYQNELKAVLQRVAVFVFRAVLSVFVEGQLVAVRLLDRILGRHVVFVFLEPLRVLLRHPKRFEVYQRKRA